MHELDLAEHLELMIGLAHEAGVVLIEYFNHAELLQKEWISKTNFSTAADKAVGEMYRNAFAADYPDYNVLSEEFPALTKGSRYTWVCDELDGTIPFRTGMDTFTTCIALCDGTTPIAGVVYAPKRNELYMAAQGMGATLNGMPIHVSVEANVNHVLMGVDSGKATEKDPEARRRKIPCLEKLLGPDGIACDLNFGCASIPLCFTACGVHQAYMATSLQPEDMAAAVIIIREAGGKVTNYLGEEWELGDASILAANPILHRKLFDLLFAWTQQTRLVASLSPEEKAQLTHEQIREEQNRHRAELVFGP